MSRKDSLQRLEKAGEIYSNEVMYWTGYVYRYWHYYTNETQIYNVISALAIRIAPLPSTNLRIALWADFLIS